MTTLAAFLRESGDPDVFPNCSVLSRWGELMREDPELILLFNRARASGRLKRLDLLANVSGGVVTRANAYFILKELPLEKIPRRFGVTGRDLRRIGVVMDGLQTAHKVERQFLRPVLKGPEMLFGPDGIRGSDLRLFDVKLSKEELQRARCYDALAYLERGETQNYRKSEDSLKGGIPAMRSNVRNRRPFWYSLSVPSEDDARLIVPEHLDSRYVVSLLRDRSTAVLDKLFVVRPKDHAQVDCLLASLNSVLVWYMMELRGRTQLGQGVLEVKKADLEGVLVVDPNTLSKEERGRLVEAFSSMRKRDALDARAEIQAMDRQRFETIYMQLLFGGDGSEARRMVEGAWRGLREERMRRPKSLEAARAARGKTEKPYQDPDAWVEKIIESVSEPPDPRDFIEVGREVVTAVEMAEADLGGEIIVRHTLFVKGEVAIGEQVVARAGSRVAAEFVRGVLLYLRSTKKASPGRIELPAEESVERALASWERAVRRWRRDLEAQVESVCSVMTDLRLAGEVRRRTLQRLSVEDLGGEDGRSSGEEESS